MNMQLSIKKLLLCCAVVLNVSLFSCSTGDQPSDVGSGDGAQACDGFCADASSFLSVTDVQQVIAQAVAEAVAQNAEATSVMCWQCFV